MEFEWDQRKNEANYTKHKINFELACEVFDDPFVALRFDQTVDGEDRWLAFGKAMNLHVLIVVHAYRTHDGREFVRIISARRATSHERRLYEEG